MGKTTLRFTLNLLSFELQQLSLVICLLYWRALCHHISACIRYLQIWIKPASGLLGDKSIEFFLVSWYPTCFPPSSQSLLQISSMFLSCRLRARRSISAAVTPVPSTEVTLLLHCYPNGAVCIPDSLWDTPLGMSLCISSINHAEYGLPSPLTRPLSKRFVCTQLKRVPGSFIE